MAPEVPPNEADDSIEAVSETLRPVSVPATSMLALASAMLIKVTHSLALLAVSVMSPAVYVVPLWLMTDASSVAPDCTVIDGASKVMLPLLPKEGVSGLLPMAVAAPATPLAEPEAPVTLRVFKVTPVLTFRVLVASSDRLAPLVKMLPETSRSIGSM